MKILLFILGAGVMVYLALKFCLYLFRPFYLKKKLKELSEMHGKVIADIDNDLVSSIEQYRSWQSGDKVLKDFRTEKEMIESIDTRKKEKAHEEAVHKKFLRLRECYVDNYKKIAEPIIIYQRYLTVKLKQRQNARLIANVGTAGVLSLDEIEAAGKETLVILEENERKLDMLLSQVK